MPIALKYHIYEDRGEGQRDLVKSGIYTPVARGGLILRLPRLWWLPTGKAPEVSPVDLKRWLDEGRPLQIADARTTVEYRQGTIADARHAPLVEMPGSMQRLELQPGVPVVVLCLSGHRSLPGTRWLRARGYEAYSLQGGIHCVEKSWLRAQSAGTSRGRGGSS